MRTTLVIFIVGLMACAADSANSSQSPGEAVYKSNCKLCHGKEGDAQVSGAKDLTVSTLTLEEAKALITEGKGAMKAYKDILSAEEIDEVSAYVLTLRKPE